MRGPARLGPDSGVSVVETILAMVLLGVTLAALIPLTVGLAERSLRSAMETHSLGVGSREMGRLAAMPWDSLPFAATCVTDTLPAFPHRRCVTVAQSGATRRVTLVITSASSLYQADTLELVRAKPMPPNPFDIS